MIITKEDLRLYLQEDAKRNSIHGKLKYIIGILLNAENALAYRYLKALRYCEYHKNNQSLLSKLMYRLYYAKLIYLGGKYHIQIPINRTGYGLKILHLSGGVVSC